MLKGFLFGLGFSSALVAFAIIAIVLLSSLRRPSAKKKHWQRYLDKLIQNEQYEEAEAIKKLIDSSSDQKRMRLPKGYYLITKYKLSKKSSFGVKRKIYIRRKKENNRS